MAGSRKKDSGSSKDANAAVFSCCKISVKEKNKHSDLTMLKLLSLDPIGMKQERTSSLIAPIFSVN